MNKTEATELLVEKLSEFKNMDWQSLKNQIGKEPIVGELSGSSGTKYQYEIQFFWDDKKDGDIRVIGNIDDGGFRAIIPLSCDFIMGPYNNLIE